MSTLEKAIRIAAEAHAGQLDKAGKPTDEDLLRREKYLAAYRFLKMDERV